MSFFDEAEPCRRFAHLPTIREILTNTRFSPTSMASRREFLVFAMTVWASISLQGCGGLSKSKELVLTKHHIAQAEAAYNRKKFTETLDRIFVWLEANNPVVAAALQPGLARSEIDTITSHLPFQLPGEVIALYQWRNGLRDDCTGSFMWYHNFLSLERAVQEFSQMRSSVVFGWNRSWFPLLDFEGEYYFVPCSRNAHSALPVCFYFTEETEAWVCYTNLTSMMATALECFDTGAVFVADKQRGILRENIREVKRIYQKHNPGLRFPYHVPGTVHGES